MRNLIIVLIGTVFFNACNAQNTSEVDWDQHLQPLRDRLIETSNVNQSLFDSLKLDDENPLHEKFLSFREARISQHQLIDSIKGLSKIPSENDYIKFYENQRKLLLQDGNLEKIKNGEKRMFEIAKSIDELKENKSLNILRTISDMDQEFLSNEKESGYHYPYAFQIFQLQYVYLTFENSLINLLPRFTEKRKGSGHPEHESKYRSKYDCAYSTFEKYVTIGDSKEKVLKLLGQPKQVFNYKQRDTTDYMLVYKHDNIHLHADTVIAWDNRDKTLKLKLQSTCEVDKVDHITIGTSKCEVLALYGTPDEIEIRTYDPSRKLYNCKEKWGYGKNSDHVCFSYKDEVMEFKNRDGSFDVKLKSSQTSKAFFTIGSTMEEVVAIQGVPTELNSSKAEDKEYWNYKEGIKYGHIEFKHGKVVSVDNRSNFLKFKL